MRRDERRGGGIPIGVRQVVAAIVIVLALVFILQNTERAPLEFLTFDGRAPLWLVLLISFVGGVVVGGLMGRRRA